MEPLTQCSSVFPGKETWVQALRWGKKRSHHCMEISSALLRLLFTQPGVFCQVVGFFALYKEAHNKTEKWNILGSGAKSSSFCLLGAISFFFLSVSCQKYFILVQVTVFITVGTSFPFLSFPFSTISFLTFSPFLSRSLCFHIFFPLLSFSPSPFLLSLQILSYFIPRTIYSHHDRCSHKSVCAFKPIKSDMDTTELGRFSIIQDCYNCQVTIQITAVL